jgi:hypothetical protein
MARIDRLHRRLLSHPHRRGGTAAARETGRLTVAPQRFTLTAQRIPDATMFATRRPSILGVPLSDSVGSLAARRSRTESDARIRKRQTPGQEPETDATPSCPDDRNGQQQTFVAARATSRRYGNSTTLLTASRQTPPHTETRCLDNQHQHIEPMPTVMPSTNRVFRRFR